MLTGHTALRASSELALPQEPTKFTEEEFHRLLKFVSQSKASDIKIQSGNHIYAKLNGRVHRVTNRSIPAAEVESMLMTLYGPNGPARIKSGNPINIAYDLHPNRLTERYRFRINAVGGQRDGARAIEITIRMISIEPPTMDQVRLEQLIRDYAFPKDGIFIMVGATGSGKSTTLASIVRHMVEDPEGNRFIITNEAPVEYVYDSLYAPSTTIFQTEIGPEADLKTFSSGMVEAMRRAPDVILNGEMRDVETIEATLAAAQSGHAVYTTLHANSVTDTFNRIVGFFPYSIRQSVMNALLSSIRCIVWQTLLPTADGKGRCAIREVMPFDRDVRAELMSVGAENMDMMLNKLRTLIPVHGQTAEACAQRLFQEGLIDEQRVLTAKSYG